MGLRLAPDPSGGDGLLQAFEVLRLDLHADLVVLSACETAIGQQVAGEGVIGLPRAFFYAGARSVAVSLWRAPDDATARLMTSFYGHLQKGQDKAESLRQAKLEQIHDRQRPFLWAPFVLVGSPIR
jgi:CHAT domain-containing protein